MAMHRYTRWASGLHGALCGDSSLSLTHRAERVTCAACAAKQVPTIYRNGAPCLPGTANDVCNAAGHRTALTADGAGAHCERCGETLG